MSKKWVFVFASIFLLAQNVWADREATFTFDKSESDNGTDVTEYRVYRSPVPGLYDMSEDAPIIRVPATQQDSYEFTVPLQEGWNWLIVTAAGPSGESNPSNEDRSFCFLPQSTTVVDTTLSPPSAVSIR